MLCACAAVLYGQAAQPAGIAPVWDVRKMLQEVAAHAERLLPVLNQIDAKEWMARGASETYADQLESCKVQCKAVAEIAQDLGRQPERLSGSLDLYFRLHALDLMLVSVQEGIRRYHNPAVADMLAAVAAEKSADRRGFEQFLIDLAAQREQQIVLMDNEAQRCRGNLSRQTPAAPANSVRTPAAGARAPVAKKGRKK